MKSKFKISILALVLAVSLTLGSCGLAGHSTNSEDPEVKIDDFTFFDSGYSDIGANDISMESKVDSFSLTEVAYGAEDKFVFTATVAFENGVAAGLIFGAEEDSHYWVFNVDREANRVKLLYFTVN